MAFMLRVRLDAASPDVSANAISALSDMAALQTEHRGVITYMFTRPDLATNPNHFEFTEVYANEGAFWAHSSHPDFMAAYVRMFPPGRDPHVTSVTYGYGPGMEGKVKSVCDIVLQKCRYPTASAGFVLSSKDWPAGATDQGNEDGPVALLFRIRAKEEEGGAPRVMQIIDDLSKEAGEGVVTCHGSIPEQETAPLDVELVLVCSTNAHVASFIDAPKVDQLFRALVKEVAGVRGEAYGTLLVTLRGSFRDLGLAVDQKNIDAGYVLHPHADRNGN